MINSQCFISSFIHVTSRRASGTGLLEQMRLVRLLPRANMLSLPAKAVRSNMLNGGREPGDAARLSAPLQPPSERLSLLAPGHHQEPQPSPLNTRSLVRGPTGRWADARAYIRAPVSWARRTRWTKTLAQNTTPTAYYRTESPVYSRRSVIDWEGRGSPRSPTGNLWVRALGSVGLKAGLFAYIPLRKH